MYAVKLSRWVRELCKTLPPEIKREARESLKELAADPFVGKPPERELAGSYSLRFMRYRIIYKIDAVQKRVTVTGIGHRSSIYETMTKLIRERMEQ